MTFTLLQIITDSTKMITKARMNATASTNYWMWIATAELIVIGYLAFKLLNKKKIEADHNPASDILTEAKKTEVNMDDLMKDINGSRQLYKHLSVKCHPDRFATDEEKRKVADELFQDISRNRRNYNKLLELQALASQKLNITF
jgi:hypothetical protein